VRELVGEVVYRINTWRRGSREKWIEMRKERMREVERREGEGLVRV